MLISTGPTTQVVEAAACTIDATENEKSTTVTDVVAASATEETVEVADDIRLMGFGFGSTFKISIAATGTSETLRVISVTSAGALEATRAIAGVAATHATASTVSEIYAATPDNGVECAATAGTDQTVTVNSNNAQTVEVWVLERDAVPITTTALGGLVQDTTVSDVVSATDTAMTLAALGNIATGDVVTLTCSTPSGRFEQVKMTNTSASAVVVRAVNGSTACETIAAGQAARAYSWHDAAAGGIGANGVKPLLNGLSNDDTFATRQYIQIKLGHMNHHQ